MTKLTHCVKIVHEFHSLESLTLPFTVFQVLNKMKHIESREARKGNKKIDALAKK